MTLPSFVDKYNGKKVEYHSYSSNSKFQCVDLVNQWIDEGLGLEAIIGTNAIGFPGKAVEMGWEWIPNFPEGIPDPGDLIVYEGQYGHIDIALEGCTIDKIKAFSQNYPTGSPCVIRTSNYLKPKCIGWLHPEENMTELETCLADRKKFWDERDVLWRELGKDNQEAALAEINRLQDKEKEYNNHQCPTNPSDPIIPVPVQGMKVNGMNVTRSSDGKVINTETNYMLDQSK